MDLTYFKFDNKYYKQIFGTPMRSPISPIIADYCNNNARFRRRNY